MSATGDLIRKLSANGATVELIALTIEAMEQAQEEHRAKGRERQRRWRERHITSPNVSNVTPPAPPETKSAPTPPEKTQPPLTPQISEANASSGGALRSPPVTQTVIDEIWAETPRKARDRSSRADVGKALRAAAQRGHSPSVIRPALKRYYASDQANDDDRRSAKGLHRMIECDRWRDWTDDRPLLQIVRTPSEQVEYESAAAAYVERQARSQGIADVQA